MDVRAKERVEGVKELEVEEHEGAERGQPLVVLPVRPLLPVVLVVLLPLLRPPLREVPLEAPLEQVHYLLAREVDVPKRRVRVQVRRRRDLISERELQGELHHPP